MHLENVVSFTGINLVQHLELSNAAWLPGYSFIKLASMDAHYPILATATLLLLPYSFQNLGSRFWMDLHLV